MDPLLTFFVTAFVSLFVTLDAVGNVPIFLSITPLAIPLLSGPGSISTVIALTGQAAKAPKVVPSFVLLLLAIALNVLIAYVVLRSATAVTRLLKETGMRIFTRVMGLILAAIAVQFVLTGIKEAFHVPA